MKKYIALAIALMALLSSCSAGRQAQNQARRQKAETAAAQQAAAASATGTYTAVTGAYKEWQTLDIPMKVNITRPMSFGCSARMQMIRNKYIGVSVRMLGFEVAYLIADTDSVHAYVKVKKSYVSESIANLFKSSGYTLGNLQDLLLGRMFLPGGATATPSAASQFALDTSDGFVVAQPVKQAPGAEIGFAMVPDDYRLVSSMIQTGAHSAAFSYGVTTPTVAGPLPTSTGIDAELTKNVAAEINWDVKSAKWNKEMSARKWKTPSGARRITVTVDLLHSLIN